MTAHSKLRLVYDREETAHYADLTEQRVEWGNTLATFRSWVLTPRMRAVFDSDPGVDVTKDAFMAWILDEPDYVITFRTVPLAWHSTTRGISHRFDKSCWQWTLGEVKSSLMTEPVWRKHYSRCTDIVDILNARIAAKNRRKTNGPSTPRQPGGTH